MSGPRSYTSSTLKRLFTLSGNQCAFPGCEVELVNRDNAANSNICHIEAAEEGGQRYNAAMTNKQRADYANLILLCPSHHVVTNDEAIYTVAKLKQMKVEHEAMVQRRMFAKRPLLSRPTLLADVVNHVCCIEIGAVVAAAQVKPFAIEAKLLHNNVIRNKAIIEEHAAYAGKLQTIYTEFDSAGAGRVDKLLRTISSLYAKQKGLVLGADASLENIQRHADDLIDAVQRELHDLIDTSPNTATNLAYEEVEFAASIILVDAFMRCKILERPQ